MSKYSEIPTPDLSGIPGAYPETPAQQTPAPSRQESYQFIPPSSRLPSQPAIGSAAEQRLPSRSPSNATPVLGGVGAGAGAGAVAAAGLMNTPNHDDQGHAKMPVDTRGAPNQSDFQDGSDKLASTTSTVVPSPVDESGASNTPKEETAREEIETESTYSKEVEGGFAPINAAPSKAMEKETRPELEEKGSNTKEMTEDDLMRVLSRRKTSHSNDMSRATTQDPDAQAEQQEINKLMSRMFGKTRQANSEEEKTRHVGVVWKGLTVKGMGLGAALQPTTGDIFLNLPRFVKNLFTKGPRKTIGKPPVRTIINDFNGCIKPGEMCLVLGRPGAGCSTFLKVIGNQRFGYESIDGDVTYGGTDAKTMGKKYRGEVLYNPEDDLHYATLKVKDTLRFALKTRTPGKSSRNEGESRAEYVSEFLRVISKLFWIEHTMGTKVGNEFVRGVSGGEKKRVSIAEAMITKASTQAWDNSTRGLDASTALEYVSSLRSLTNMAHISTAVALYQAGESLYERFDKVMLIEQGQCCYFGPADQAARYFKDLGFVQPDRWTTADFLTSVTDEHERHIKEGWENRIPRSAAQFADAFTKSERAKENLVEIEEFEQDNRRLAEERRIAQTKATKKKNFTLPFHKQVWVCTKRQFLVMIGDKQSLGGKWGGILFQAVIVGSLFFNLPKTSSGVFPRGGVLFFMLLFNALLALAELTAAFESRPILLKHKSFSFYRPSAYAIAQTVVDVPLVLIQVFIFDVVVYFMSGLQATASQFFISLLVLFLITMTMYAFFRSLGALLGSLDAATRVTGVAIQALIVYTGYLIPPAKMWPWFSWLRWINPVQYGFEALMANEFYNLEIQCTPPFLVPQVPNVDPRYQGCTIQGSTPGSTIVQGSNYIDVAYSYKRSHLWRNVGFIIAFFIFFVVLTAVGMELQKPNKGGGAVTIYKRGQVPGAVDKAMQKNSDPRDEETGKDKDEGSAPLSESSDSNDQAVVEELAKNETVFTFQNVDYTIPYEGGERTLLNNVQGYVKPGKLTALMGASGAGKTTLLNTLAQRIRFGVVSGDFLVDGAPLPRSFQRSSGFAEQQDIHEPTATVREALRFSAKLRQPKEVPIEEKYAYCETILDLLEMREIAGAAIGTIGNGLNQEQRKRLTIGVELASKPELLMFLDEPTSGLDSGAAFNIVRFLRKLADAGQAILCTIHQPSSVLFEHFDMLLLLKSGGQTVYFGELGHDSRTLLDYLEGNGSKKCAPKENPAEFMLEAIGAGNPDYKGQDWGETWAKSKENAAIGKEIQDVISSRRDRSDKSETSDNREYAMPLTTQITTVLHRSFTALWRSPEYVVGMFMLHIFTGLFNTFTFWHLGNTQIDMQSRLFSIFMTLTICPPLIQQLQPRFLNARNIFEGREANSKIYSWIAFVIGVVVSEIPYRIVAGTIYWCCWYWAPAFPRDTFTSAVMWLYVIAFELFYLGFGQAIAAFAPNELLASLLVPVFFLFVVSFCGVVVPFMALPYFWRSWMYYLSPFTYLLEGMLALVVHNVPVTCATNELAIFPAPPNQSCQAYAGPYAQQAGGYVETLPDGQCGFCQYSSGDAFAASFNVYYRHLWRDFGFFWAYIVFNFVVVFIASWFYLKGGKSIKGLFTKKKGLKSKKGKRDSSEKA